MQDYADRDEIDPLDEIFVESHEKPKHTQPEAVKNYFNSIPEFITGSISKLREKDMTYKEIGKLLEMNPGQVQMLVKGTWYPKTRKVENHIFQKLMSLPINSKGEGKNE